ncbi:septum formation family protein [Actinoplanes sp. NPDC048967]|uniref:septum formation family protein n=1 Tax=Actinoplanes sp. NPDC048967 TaxID=3155269 RepID=UPI0033D7A94D
MRHTAVLLAVLLTAGCSGAPPDGTDGDLTDDWRTPSSPAPFRPATGECHEMLAATAALDDYRPVDCAELHVSETFHVGTAADADVVPAAGTAGARAAFQECSTRAAGFLGGPWRTARVAVQVVWPTKAAWSGGARWFRCDVTTADLDGQSRTSRTGSLAGELAGASPLKLGCFNPTVDGETVTTMRPVPCEERHRAEFAGLWKAPEITYAALESGTERSAAGCRGVIAKFAKLPDDSDMQYRTGWISYNPTRTEWLSGERRVRCFVYFAKRTFTRSLKGAGPSVLPVD